MNDRQTTMRDMDEGQEANPSAVPRAASRALDRQYTDVIASLALDVRSPLSAVLEYHELLYDVRPVRRAEDEEQFVQGISENALSNHCLTSNYLYLTRSELGF